MRARQQAFEQRFGIKTNHPDGIMSCVNIINFGPWIIGYAYVALRREDEPLPEIPVYYYEQTGKTKQA
ncbi:MAG: hypothetical protein SPL80_06720 [Bacilli bacterium]|nr:hypothetical protein [Bacilli bacterium]